VEYITYHRANNPQKIIVMIFTW